jgi:hypothetical protein
LQPERNTGDLAEMADLQATCPKCSKTSTFSEFVSDEALMCRGCGAELPRPQRSDPKPKPRVKTIVPGASEAPNEDTRPPTDAAPLWPGRHRPRQQGRAKVRHHIYAWLVFFVLGGAATYLRYGGGLPPAYLGQLQRYAAVGLIACHLIVMIKAFEDSVYQGILCLLVPFYTLYYVFAVTDAVYLRAVMGAVLIAVGQDGFMSIQERAFAFSEKIRAWIASGG